MIRIEKFILFIFLGVLSGICLEAYAVDGATRRIRVPSVETYTIHGGYGKNGAVCVSANLPFSAGAPVGGPTAGVHSVRLHCTNTDEPNGSAQTVEVTVHKAGTYVRGQHSGGLEAGSPFNISGTVSLSSDKKFQKNVLPNQSILFEFASHCGENGCSLSESTSGITLASTVSGAIGGAPQTCISVRSVLEMSIEPKIKDGPGIACVLNNYAHRGNGYTDAYLIERIHSFLLGGASF